MFNPYSYEKHLDEVKIGLHESNSRWALQHIEFKSAFDTRCLGETPVMGEYLCPKGRTRAPLAILVHGMGDKSVIPCRMVARDLAKKGIASFLLYLVFHSFRAPVSISGRYPRLTSEEWFEGYQQSVIDIRQIVDWAATRPEIDQSQIFALGISYGSFITSIAMALDRRITKGVLVECGGNSDKLTKHSLMLRWRYRQSTAVFQKRQADYARYLQLVAAHGWENVPAEKSSYLTDPLTFSLELKGRPLLMINAVWDEIIPKIATDELWESLGEPPIHWYPATHASLWLWYFLFKYKITGFLQEGSKR